MLFSFNSPKNKSSNHQRNGEKGKAANFGAFKFYKTLSEEFSNNEKTMPLNYAMFGKRGILFFFCRNFLSFEPSKDSRLKGLFEF